STPARSGDGRHEDLHARRAGGVPRRPAQRVAAVRGVEALAMSRRVQHAVFLPALAILASAMCYYSVMAGSHFVDSAHHGFFLKNAIDIFEGRVLFRDSFNSYGLLSALIHAAGLKVWGWRIPALLNVTLVFVVALGLSVYVLWSHVMPPWAAFLAAALYF